MRHLYLLLTTCYCLMTSSGTGQAVNPSNSFGECGITGQPFSTAFLTRGMLREPDGKILVYGKTTQLQMAFVRYLPSGILDPGFGNGGKTEIAFRGYFNQVNDLVRQPDGKYVGVGAGSDDPASASIIGLVFRLNANGSPDLSFNGNGYTNITIGFPATCGFANVALTSTNEIMAAGQGAYKATETSSGIGGAFAVKLTATGTLVSNFGNLPNFPGRTFIQVTSRGIGDVQRMALLDDGGLGLIWTRIKQTPSGFDEPIVLDYARIQPTGAVTTGPNGELYSTIDARSFEPNIMSLLPLQGGKFMIGTSTIGTFPSIARPILIRMNADFTPDAGFGTNGLVEYPPFEGNAQTSYTIAALAQQPDGKILLSGSRLLQNSINLPYTVRVNTDGNIDQNFNSNGFFLESDLGDGPVFNVSVQSIDNNRFLTAIQKIGRVYARTLVPEAITGGTLKFDGGNDYMNIGNWFNYQRFTIEAWIKPGSIQSPNATLFGNEYISLYRSGPVNDFYFYSENNGSGIAAYAPMTLDEWQHFAFVIDDNSIKVYKNGQLVTSLPHAGPIRYMTNQPLYIGTDFYLPSRTWNGAMDELRIWNRALTAEEIQDRMNCELGPNQNGLQAYYKFNQGYNGCNNSGIASAIDLSGNNRNGTLFNFALAGTASNFLGGQINGTCGVLVTFYRDNDGDGFGDPNTSTQAINAPAGYVSNNTDCNDNNAASYPGATETCNGVDDNCDGQTDEGLLQTFYQDIDGDGYGNPAVSIQACTAPAGYVPAAGDCSDNQTALSPGATEICDGIDNDCDGLIDEDIPLLTWYLDNDGDGFGNSAVSLQNCSQPAGYVGNNSDCNDNNPAINPGATEICNGIDDDCDGQIDEAVLNTYYPDADGDGFGSATGVVQACTAPAGFVSSNSDCNDADNKVYPGAAELCDGKDNDCDGQIDEGISFQTYYRDQDGDSYGTASQSQSSCAPVAGYVTQAGDCNDNNAAINPGVTETCNGIDDDCDGQIDEAVLNTYYPDADGDGHGSATGAVQACTAPAGFVSSNTDCNDNDPGVNPAASEKCNGIDDDCDGQIDENLLINFYPDADRDGWGSATGVVQACIAPAGFVSSNTDCNDADDKVYPGAAELCDGKDNDCDGTVDEDCPESEPIWTWMSGSNLPANNPTYGVQGAPAAANTPGGKLGHVTWTDLQGRLWLFGGNNRNFSLPTCDQDPSLFFGVNPTDELWMFDPKSNQWTWISGRIGPSKGVYGRRGIADNINKPGSRTGASSWIDKRGNLWLFGGLGFGEDDYGLLNDLWVFNPITKQWTWVNGSKRPGRVSIAIRPGVFNVVNTPGSRSDAACWEDKEGRFWLFGGRVSVNSNEEISDMWIFDPIINRWAQVSISGRENVIATVDTPDTRNHPGARHSSLTWTDKQGKLWLLGGRNPTELADFWSFDTKTRQWTCVSIGVGQTTPIYGTKGIPSNNNRPGRRSGAATWTDKNGDLWLFGGSSRDDLWKYVISSRQWTWMKGSNVERQHSVFGTKTVGDVANTPGVRNLSGFWTDLDGNFWLMGGSGFVRDFVCNRNLSISHNNLWKLDIGSPPINSVVNNTTRKKDNYLTITDQPAAKPSMRVYPNPANQLVQVELNAAFSGEVSIRVLDAQGRLVHVEKLEAAGAKQTHRIRTDNMKGGLYIIMADDTHGNRVQQRLVIQR